MTGVTEQKPLTKSEFIGEIVDETEMTKIEVSTVFKAMYTVIARELNRRKGPRAVTILGLLKITNVRIDRRPAQKGVKNPFTGEVGDRPAKPAHNKVKVRALKALKDMA